MAQQLLDRIRDHMESAGLSKSGVARAAGLHPNSLRSMDSESWNPTADTLSRLESWLNRDGESPLVGTE